MRLTTQFVAVALSVKENEFERDGNKNKYYQVSLDQDGECGTLSCTEDCFAKGIEKYKPYVFTCQFDSNNNRLRVMSMQPYKN